MVGLNLDINQAQEFVAARMGKVIEMDGCRGAINTFIIEPFVPHDQEYYLCISRQRLSNEISFSEQGGVEIEANWDKVQASFSQTSSSPELFVRASEPVVPVRLSAQCVVCLQLSNKLCRT